jgi:hypothetical protein
MTTPLDPRDLLRRATRFFARPESFTLECPRCGRIYVIRLGKKNPCWDHTRSIFECVGLGGCSKSYIVGIVAWPIAKNARVAGFPRDQIPNERQLAQMRQEGGGWWLPDVAGQRHARVDTTNLTLEEDRPLVDPDTEEPE